MDITTLINITEIKWIILLITISLSVMDFYIRRIPNVINVGTFAVFLVAALLIKEREPILILKDISLVAIVSYFLYYINALGGGDCKYLIAISPIISAEILFKIVVLAMALFVLSYMVKKLFDCIVTRKVEFSKKFELHKMPFIWSLLPGFYIFALKI